MKSRIIGSILVLAGMWGVIQLIGIDNKNISCVNVYVDFQQLDNGKKISQCVSETGKTAALQVLGKANINITGTEKYGLAVACRVNGLPTAAQEPCLKMPPANAYWAVIIKKGDSFVNPNPQWGWAQTGISDVYLYPGDSLGLVFTSGDKIKWPS